MPHPIFIMFIGGLIAVVGAFIGYWGKLQFDLDSRKKNEVRDLKMNNIDVTTQKIDTTSSENLGLTKQIDTTVTDSKAINIETSDNVQILKQKLIEQNEQLNTSQTTIDKLRTENLTLHDRVAHISNNIYNTMYGGDSYLSVDILDYSGGANELTIMGIVEGDSPHKPGKYPINSAEISISLDNNVIYAESKKGITTEVVFNLTKYHPPANKNFLVFSIQILASNKNYMQYIFMKKHTDGRWFFYKIGFDDLYKVLLRQQELQSGYPDDLKEKYPSIKLIDQENIKPITNDTKEWMKKKEFKQAQ